jgi:tetratricopeptide (TPR) repeat protein
MTKAAAAMQRGDYAVAEVEYRSAAALAPQTAQLLSNLGLALTLQEKFDEAEKQFRASLKFNSKLFVPNYFLGKRLFQTNRYAEAKSLLLAALAVKPEDTEARRWLAVTYLGLKEHRNAIAEYRALLKANPQDEDALYAIGKTYTALMEDALRKISTETNSLERNLMLVEAVQIGPAWRSLAKSELPRLIAENPSALGLHRELGNLESEDGNWKVSEKLFREELALDSLDYRAHFGLAQASLAQRQLAAFGEQLEKATHIRPEFFCPLPDWSIRFDKATLQSLASQVPSDLGARFLLAVANNDDAFCQKLKSIQQEVQTGAQRSTQSTEELFRQKRFEAVIKRYETSHRKGSTLEKPPALLARAYFETGDYESAAQTMETAMRKGAMKDAEYYLLCRSYQKLAVKALEEMERRFPDAYRAHQLMGETLLAKQNPREALQPLKLALQRKPEDPEILYLIGRCHYLLGEFLQAFEFLQHAIRCNPYNAEAHYLIGEGLVYTQQGAKAIPYLTRALELNSSMLRAHAELGKAYLQVGQPDAAAKELEKAATLDSSGDLHYLLYRAYSRLNQKAPAAKALATSTKLRDENSARQRRAVESRN